MIRALAALASALVLSANHSGITAFMPTPLRAGEQLRFDLDEGRGWTVLPIHKGALDKSLYDRRVAPGTTITVRARLFRKGRVVAEARRQMTMEADRRYMIYAAVQADNPTRGCFGCIGVNSMPIRGESGASARRLWVYSSFNGISHPILF